VVRAIAASAAPGYRRSQHRPGRRRLQTRSGLYGSPVGKAPIKRNAPYGDCLDVLVALVEAWECKYYSIDPQDPLEAISRVARWGRGPMVCSRGVVPRSARTGCCVPSPMDCTMHGVVFEVRAFPASRGTAIAERSQFRCEAAAPCAESPWAPRFKAGELWHTVRRRCQWRHWSGAASSSSN
jgi:hypothetical protein